MLLFSSLRFAFIQCVMQATHRSCEPLAAKFIQPLAETLLRSRLQGHLPAQCISMKPEHCPGARSSGNKHRTTLLNLEIINFDTLKSTLSILVILFFSLTSSIVQIVPWAICKFNSIYVYIYYHYDSAPELVISILFNYDLRCIVHSDL